MKPLHTRRDLIYMFTFLLTFLTIDHLQANSYYVAPWGDDNNSGTLGSPWGTINKAAQEALAGDIVYIRGGIYKINDRIEVANNGTSTAWITFTAYNNEKPVILADNPQASGDAAFRINQKNYIRIIGLTVKRSYGEGIKVVVSNHIDLIRNEVDSTWGPGIGVWGNAGQKIPSAHIRLLGNKVTHTNIWAMIPPGLEQPKEPPHESISLGRVEDYEVAYNELAFFGKEGIDSKGPCKRGKIHHNYIHDGQRVGIYVDAWTSAIEDIELSQNLIIRCSSGININSEDKQEVYRVQVHHNRILDVRDLGLNMGTSNTIRIKDVEVINNTIFNAGRCISIEPMVENVQVYNNIFHEIENNQPIVIKNGAQNIDVQYNLNQNDLSVNPAFANPENYNVHLTSSSPAINAGNPAAQYNDPDGSLNDQGALDFAQNDQLPQPPAQFTVQTDSYHQVSLVWQDISDNESGFILERKAGAEDYVEMIRLGANTESFTDYGLLPGQTYFYRLRSFNNTGETSTSEVQVTTTEDGYFANLYTLEVVNGTGSGSFEEGAVINIFADQALPGDYFLAWNGDIDQLEDVNDDTIQITMLAREMTLEAEFAKSPLFNLVVTDGDGGGKFPVREKVLIKAKAAPKGYIFDTWTGDVEQVENIYHPETWISMPFEDVNIAASYKIVRYDQETAFANEDFSKGQVGPFYPYPSGSLSKENWNEGAARYQIRGYEAKKENPLTYPGLLSTDMYVSGGNSAQSIQIKLDTKDVFDTPSDYTNSHHKIGYNHSIPATLYTSFLLRRQGGYHKMFWLGFTEGNLPWQPPYAVTTEDLNWNLRLGGTVYPSQKPVKDNETALIVLKMTFLTKDTTHFEMYVNPDLSLNEEPAPDVTASDYQGFVFDYLSILLGGDANQGALDEIRFGNSFQAVTPEPTVSSVEKVSQLHYVYPNPVASNHAFQIKLERRSSISVIDLRGNLIMKETRGTGNHSFSTDGWSPQVYIINIDYGQDCEKVKLLIK